MLHVWCLKSCLCCNKQNSKLLLVTHMRIFDNEVSGTWRPPWSAGGSIPELNFSEDQSLTLAKGTSKAFRPKGLLNLEGWLFRQLLQKAGIQTDCGWPSSHLSSTLTNLPLYLFHEKRKKHRHRVEIIFLLFRSILVLESFPKRPVLYTMSVTLWTVFQHSKSSCKVVTSNISSLHDNIIP